MQSRTTAAAADDRAPHLHIDRYHKPSDAHEVAAAERDLRELVAGATLDTRSGQRPGAAEESPFASKSLRRHLLSGAVGFGSLIGSLVLLPVRAPVPAQHRQNPSRATHPPCPGLRAHPRVI